MALERGSCDYLAVTTSGTVRFWRDEKGHGVIDWPETPGGCWTHFGAVAVAGYRSLQPGQPVVLEGEKVWQDGYAYRAVRAWPADQSPVDTAVDEACAAGTHASRLTLTFKRESPTEDVR